MQRRLVLPSVALAVLLACADALPADAAWPTQGRSMCNGCTGAHFTRAAPDGSGGAYVLWTDSRNFLTTGDDIFLQHVLASGELAPGWPPMGLAICDTMFRQRGIDLVADGDGGAIALWTDSRSQGQPGGSSRDVFAQRVQFDGSLAPGWMNQGSAVSRAPDVQTPSSVPAIASDGQGGAFFVWEDYRDVATTPRSDIYMQHLTGAAVPAPGWPTHGRALTTALDQQWGPIVASDHLGRAFAAWRDYRDLPGAFDQGKSAETFGTSVLADGSDAPGWVPGGQRLRTGPSRPAGIVADGVGGAYVVTVVPNAAQVSESLLVAQRFGPDGTPVIGWPAEGVTLCNSPGTRDPGPVCGDGLGGLLVAWSGSPGGDIFAARLRPDGTLAPGWPPNGLRVSGPELSEFGEFDPTIAPDGVGGCYVAWDRPTGCCNEVRVQHVTSMGNIAPGWPTSGLKVESLFVSADDPTLVTDGSGGAILIYSSPVGRPYAQKFTPDGVVATQLSLVSAEARPDAVELRWHAGGDRNVVATLERRRGTVEAWRTLAELLPDGLGTMSYTDRDVIAGERYGYRLRWNEHGATRMTSETWVEIPSALRFALHGLQPNPSPAEPLAAFTLPGWANGELELLDVSGRRLVSREVGSLGPGRHVVRLDEGTRVPPGLYVLRLRWSGQVATTRGIVMR